MHGDINWLSLPVGQNFGKTCREVLLTPPDNNYVNNIIKTIEFSYAKAKFFSVEWDELKKALAEPLQSHSNLVEVNISIIKNIMDILEIPMPDLYFSSHLLDCCDDPTERILKICNHLKLNSVVVGNGMSLKVHEWDLLTSNGIKLEMQDYSKMHPEYVQFRRKRAGFRKGLTIIDAILNVGREEAREYITDEKYRPKCFEIQG